MTIGPPNLLVVAVQVLRPEQRLLALEAEEQGRATED
jgi:hypothetical protein